MIDADRTPMPIERKAYLALERSKELALLELAVEESKRLGVAIDELKGLLSLAGPEEPAEVLLKRDPDPREHPFEQYVRKLAIQVGMSLLQLEELSRMERTLPPVSKDPMAGSIDDLCLDMARRLGISLDLYYLLGRGVKPEEIEDIEIIPHRM